MTRKDLQEYCRLGREIALYEEQLISQEDELKRIKGLDIVKGSSPEFPYILHNISLETEGGSLREEYQKTIRQLKQTIKARQEKMRRIERYIADIRDSETRRIFMLRYVGRNLSWSQVAQKMGEGYNADAVRMRHDRYFKKI